MEKFKKKLKKRIVFGSVYCGLIPLLAIALHFCVGETLSSGFTLGFACGIAAVSLVFVIQSARALCSDEKLRKMYIAEKYSLQGTTQGRYLTGGVPPVRFSM